VQCLRRFAAIHQYPDGVRMVGFASYDACIALKLAAGLSKIGKVNALAQPELNILIVHLRNE
jgi:hypothetical protein